MRRNRTFVRFPISKPPVFMKQPLDGTWDTAAIVRARR